MMNGRHISASFWNQLALNEYRSNSRHMSDCKINFFTFQKWNSFFVYNQLPYCRSLFDRKAVKQTTKSFMHSPTTVRSNYV